MGKGKQEETQRQEETRKQTNFSDENPDLPYWQWLCSCPILTRHQIHVLLKYFGTVEDLYEAPAGALEPFLKMGGKWARSLAAYKETCSLEDCAGLLKARDMHFCDRKSPAYPAKLLSLPDSPYGLFYKGTLPGEHALSVAVIGARRCSSYGARMASYLGAQLAQRRIQVISGMAAGIDSLAQKACLREGGSSFAVLGCGADICYPPENRSLYQDLAQKGGILSEYGPATPPLASNFPIRNRLISGLADAVIVVEARKKSGSLITVDLALDQGKEVYAVPGRFGEDLSYGCNHLIQQGANLLSSVDQVLKDLAGQVAGTGDGDPILYEETRTRALPAGEEQVFRILDQDGKDIDELMEETDLQLADLCRDLISLQAKGLAEEVSRGRYRRADW